MDEILSQYEEKLKNVEDVLDRILFSNEQNVLESGSLVEQAKLKTAMAHAVQCLQICSLRTEGKILENKKYLNRIKAYYAKLNQLD